MKKAAKKKTKVAKLAAKATAKKPAAKATAKKPAAKPAPKAVSRPAKTVSGRSSAGDAAKGAGRYMPPEVPGTGWPPFRYPPA